MRARLIDVARLAGVSMTTASRVMAKAKYPVHPDTRDAVVEAAEALGYQPQRRARTDRTPLGYVLVDPVGRRVEGRILAHEAEARTAARRRCDRTVVCELVLVVPGGGR